MKFSNISNFLQEGDGAHPGGNHGGGAYLRGEAGQGPKTLAHESWLAIALIGYTVSALQKATLGLIGVLGRELICI